MIEVWETIANSVMVLGDVILLDISFHTLCCEYLKGRDEVTRSRPVLDEKELVPFVGRIIVETDSCR